MKTFWYRLACALMLSGIILSFLTVSAFAIPQITGLTSPTHPNTSTWYQYNDPVFTWDPVPDQGTLVGSLDTPGTARDLVVAGEYAYVADDTSGLQIINISDPANPVLAGTYDTPGEAYDVEVSGDYAYVADGSGGLRVFNVMFPSNPVLTGYMITPGGVQGLTVSGTRAYLAAGSSGMLVVDISNAANPVLIGTFSNPGAAVDVDVSGSHAYVLFDGAGQSGMHVVDVTDPYNPVGVGYHLFRLYESGYQWSYWAEGESVVADGTTVYAAYTNVTCECGGFGAPFVTTTGVLRVLDVSDPANPVSMGSISRSGYIYDVALNGSSAFIVNGNNGVGRLDVSDPANVQTVLDYDTQGTAMGVAVDANYAYVADGNSGLMVIDMTNLTPAQYSFILDQSSSTDPDAIPEGTMTSASYSDLPDGVYYFHIGVVVDGVLGPVRDRGIRIGASCGVPPDILISNPAPYWASLADYNNGLLTATFEVSNGGSSSASNVYILGVSMTNGVTLCATCTPVRSLGNLAPGESKMVTQLFTIPAGVSNFRVNFNGSGRDICGNSFSYGV